MTVVLSFAMPVLLLLFSSDPEIEPTFMEALSTTTSDPRPQVCVIAPDQNEIYVTEGPVEFEVLAADTSFMPVRFVEFYANDLLLDVDSVPPYKINWQAVFPGGDGVVLLSARALDINGNEGFSANRKVTVADPLGPTYILGDGEFGCSNPLTCIPIEVGGPGIANVTGLEITISYDGNRLEPTGLIEESSELLDASLFEVDIFVDEPDEEVRLVVSLSPGAPLNTSFDGVGELLCVGFERRIFFFPNDTADIEITHVRESFLIGINDVTDIAPATITLEKPTVNCPADVILECNASSPPNTSPAFTGSAEAVLDCGSYLNVTFSDIVQNLPGQCADYIIKRTWTTQGTCVNVVSCVQLIHVVDTTPPVISCPSDTVLYVDQACAVDTSVLATGMATAGDSCSDSSAIVITHADSIESLSCSGTFTIIRYWRAEDNCQNVAVCTQRIEVLDTIPPAFAECPQQPIKLFCSIEPDTQAAINSAGLINDNCGVDTVIASVMSEDTTDCVFRRLYQVVGIDVCGNTDTCNIEFEWIDDSVFGNRDVSCGGDINLGCNPLDLPSINDASEELTVTGFCNAIDTTIVVSAVTQDPFDETLFSQSFKFIVTDTCGGQDSCTRVFNWQIVEFEIGSGPGSACGCPSIETRCVISLSSLTDSSGVLLESSTSLTCDKLYTLDRTIYVADGQVLVVEPGTVVKATSGTEFSLNSLIVARGGQIIASGTQDCPVIFTSASDPVDQSYGARNRGDWGGIVLSGRAANNLLGVSGNAVANGVGILPGRVSSDSLNFYGVDGGVNDDNSGVLRYVSIRHGARSLNGQTTAGLTLASVGAGTTVENVEIVSPDGFGLNLLGGSVDVRFISVLFGNSNSIDISHGWSGRGQYWATIKTDFSTAQNANSAIRVSGDSGEEVSFYGAPRLCNLTLTGSTDVNGSAQSDTSSAIVFCEGGRAEVSSSIISGFQTGVRLAEDGDVHGGGGDSYQLWMNGLLKVDTSTFEDVGDLIEGSGVVLAASDTATFISKGNNKVTSIPGFNRTHVMNVFNNVVDIQHDLVPGVNIVPVKNQVPDGFFTPSSYRGAFGAGLESWTSLYTFRSDIQLEVGLIPCPGDIVPDGAINTQDFLELLSQFNTECN